MYLQISFLLLFSFLFVSVTSSEIPLELFRDHVFVKELNTLESNRRNASINLKMETTLTLAQLIIDSNIAPKSVIRGMKSLTTKWRPVEGRASREDFKKCKKEYEKALGKFGKSDQRNDYLNYFTRGAYSALTIKSANENEQREAAYNAMEKAAVKMAELRREEEGTDDSFEFLKPS